ncbi:MAG TPA: 16S rRNA (cytidine(1402)-2'-O)-methyltransferase [Deltaproteobacteria bacterium]|nr:16S rRNA (cytidine(1402)-2'-O)-methyltransferase [Deltaproteobacteria bacterium]
MTNPCQEGIMGGILYVVATPIGNLKDITLRAIDVLNQVEYVVAENRERALNLLSYLNIRKKIISINSYNEERKSRKIIEYLIMNQNCALISSAGTPCISDPGSYIVRKAYETGIDVRVVPGPSAASGAISASGLYADRFLFFGFLPLKGSKKKRVLRELSLLPYPIVFFESPRRLVETLQFMLTELGNRNAVVFKEMTKLYEETFRDKLEALINRFQSTELKGEYTIIVDGRAG